MTGTIGLVLLICMAFFYIYRMVKKEILDKPDTLKKDIYDVKLYFDNGALFKKYANVYITHWDNNIYILKNDRLDELVHKSENMTLIRKKIA